MHRTRQILLCYEAIDPLFLLLPSSVAWSAVSTVEKDLYQVLFYDIAFR